MTTDSLTDKTIVLDMDSTLICTIGDGSDISRILREKYTQEYNSLVDKGVIIPSTLVQYGGSGKAYHNDVIKRPGVDQFLNFCKKVFKCVILWSAGQPSYVFDVVKHVLDPDNEGVFDHIYTSKDIVHETWKDSTFPTKPLKLIQKNFPDSLLENTIIVDDLVCNFAPNPLNGVLIPAFSPKLQDILTVAKLGVLDNMCDDYSLLALLHFLSDADFLCIEDVRDYDLKFF